MNLRATWVCFMVAIFGICNLVAFSQDDFEVPGLGVRRGGLMIDPGFVQFGPVVQEAPPVEEPLPDDAQAILDAHNKDAHAIRRKAEQEIAARRDKTVKALQVLQDKYTRDAKLDEAVAIRDKIRKLRVSHLKPLPNPGNLQNYINKLDRSFYFDVTGAVNGPVWGTEVYTYDSSLATAAVHAGVLKPGQRGIVKITMIRSPDAHVGSVANGVRSGGWGAYPASYTVESPEPTEDNATEPATTP